MPRGVYARKSAQQKTAGKGKAKAKAAAAPKAASKAKARAPLAGVLTTAVSQLAQPVPQFSAEDFRKPIDDMGGELLRAFARRIGIMQRDVDRLTEDRLRQNCKARQIEMLED